MLKSRRTEILVAAILIAPFVAIYAWMFLYPTFQMVGFSFTNAPLIGSGDWVGTDNYTRLFKDRIFLGAIWNTAYFVLLTVVPGTIAALAIALMVSRLKGWMQSLDPVGLFPALCHADLGGLPDLALDARQPVRRHSGHTGADLRPARQRLAPHSVLHADRGLAHDLVDQRLFDPAVPRRSAQHPARDL